MKGLSRIQAMANALRGDGPIKQRLTLGGQAFWSATIDADTWPPVLKAQVEALQGRLLTEGPIDKTVARMDEQTAQHVLEVLLRFADAFEAMAKNS